MANQAYAKQKLVLWVKGYKEALQGMPARKNYDQNYQDGYKKGVEVKLDIEEKGLPMHHSETK